MNLLKWNWSGRGHCIGVDPYYLTYKAKNWVNPKVILAARKKINETMHNLLKQN